MRWLTWKNLWLPRSPQVSCHYMELILHDGSSCSSQALSATCHSLHLAIPWMARPSFNGLSTRCSFPLTDEAFLHHPWLVHLVLLLSHQRGILSSPLVCPPGVPTKSPLAFPLGRPQCSQLIFPHHALSQRHLRPCWIRAQDLQSLIRDISCAAGPEFKVQVLV